MTEEEWTTCGHPRAMLEELIDYPNRDKFRLLACHWCLSSNMRRLLESQHASRFLAAAESFIAGRISSDELIAEVLITPKSWKTGGPWRSPNPVRLSQASQALRAVAALAAPDPYEAAWRVAQEAVNLLVPTDCDLIRNLFDRVTRDCISKNVSDSTND